MAAGDGGHPPLGQPALGVELHDGAVAEGLDLLSPAQPQPLLAIGATPGWGAGRDWAPWHRVQGRRGGLTAALGGGSDGALADGLGVAGGHAQAGAGEGLRSDGQVVPSSAAAVFTDPSRSASWKARSASARSARQRLDCSPGLGFIHTGHELSFVYNTADLYKADVTIPTAFDVAVTEPAEVGAEIRRALRGRFYGGCF
jgi:hypothetical protein